MKTCLIEGRHALHAHGHCFAATAVL